jgi:CheY-like chemotaxis protein
MKHEDLHKAQPILIVEDSMPDYQAVLRVIRKKGMENPVYHCKTGQEALDYLYHLGNFTNKSDAPRPGIVLLDLNLPETDGREVLKKIKSDDGLKSIPIVIFTTSDSDKDIAESYNSGANTYITKPVDLEELYNVIDTFKNYWFETASISS